MKNTKGIIILLGLILACLLFLSIYLTIQLLRLTHGQDNPTNTSAATTAGTSETTFGTSSRETAGTTTTTSTSSETTSAVTTRPSSPPSTTSGEPAITTTAAKTPGLITAKQAEAIALGLFEGDVRVLEMENHTDDSPPHYEIELTDGDYDYALKIHAVTGAVIDYEREPVEGDESETEG